MLYPSAEKAMNFCFPLWSFSSSPLLSFSSLVFTTILIIFSEMTCPDEGTTTFGWVILPLGFSRGTLFYSFNRILYCLLGPIGWTSPSLSIPWWNTLDGWICLYHANGFYGTCKILTFLSLLTLWMDGGIRTFLQNIFSLCVDRGVGWKYIPRPSMSISVSIFSVLVLFYFSRPFIHWVPGSFIPFYLLY